MLRRFFDVMRFTKIDTCLYVVNINVIFGPPADKRDLTTLQYVAYTHLKNHNFFYCSFKEGFFKCDA